MKHAIALALLVVVGCKSDRTENPAPKPAPTAPAPTGELPRAQDVLPKGEATPNTRVVVGDGFRYQIPEGFQKVEHPSKQPAYQGNVDGFAGPAPLTFWAMREPFTGNLDALVEREAKAATAAGAKVPTEGMLAAGPVLVQVAGAIKKDYARRTRMQFADHFDLRTMVVHDGHAYIHHCETPTVPNAWANVGTDCITRGTTFHVAPP